MPLSWNEIKSRAMAFSREWETESSEDAEAKTFWDQFFHVFGLSRRRIASFRTNSLTAIIVIASGLANVHRPN